MQTLKISNEFIMRCKDYDIQDIERFVIMLIRHFVPVQKLSDAMKNSKEQCSFNLRENELIVNDPFNLFDTNPNFKKFEIQFSEN